MLFISYFDAYSTSNRNNIFRLFFSKKKNKLWINLHGMWRTYTNTNQMIVCRRFYFCFQHDDNRAHTHQQYMIWIEKTFDMHVKFEYFFSNYSTWNCNVIHSIRVESRKTATGNWPDTSEENLFFFLFWKCRSFVVVVIVSGIKTFVMNT